MVANLKKGGNPMIEQFLAEYADLKAQVAPVLERIKVLEREIKSVAVECGGLDTPMARVEIRKAYERVSWDSRALAGYAAVHPEILQFRKVTQVGVSAAIKIKK
jgi:hypothetical protein